MLASITPLGERSRRQRWWVTVTALITGAGVAGAAFGAALAGTGRALPLGTAVRLDLLLGIAALGATVDLLGRLPTHRRQVDELWLHRYRSWVYGLGFGAQLGVGVSTIVTTGAVYVTLAAAALAQSVIAGAAIGGVFGLLRGATVLFAVHVDSPRRLALFHRRLRRLEPAARRLALVAQAAVVAAVAAATL